MPDYDISRKILKKTIQAIVIYGLIVLVYVLLFSLFWGSDPAPAILFAARNRHGELGDLWLRAFDLTKGL